MVKNLELSRKTILKKSIAKKMAKEATEIKTVDQLRIDLATKQNELIEVKRGHKLGELTNPCVIKATRKQIARLHTAIRLANVVAVKEIK